MISFSKRGVSAVVATVLIVLITVAAIGIIWVAIVPMVKDSLLIGDLCKEVDISINSVSGYTCYDIKSDLVAVSVNKGPNAVEISRVMFVVYSNGESFSFTEKVNLSQQGTKIFYLNMSECYGSIDKVTAFAVVKNNNVEKQCGAITLKNVPICNNSLSDINRDSILQRYSGDYDDVDEDVPVPEIKEVSCVNDSVCDDWQYCSNSICKNKTIGSGTLADPFNIYTCVELQNIKNNLSASYSLARDIDCVSTTFSSIIGVNFTGTLNGDNHKISNLKINKDGMGCNSNENRGIYPFKILSGNISNIIFVNSSSSAAGCNVGSQSVYATGLAKESYGIIDNVHFLSGNIVSGSGAYASGIVSENRGIIKRSSFEGNVTGAYAGGIANSNYGKILSSYVIGVVSVNSFQKYNSYGGGLVGQQQYGSVINNSYFIGSVNVNGNTSNINLKVGGLIATNEGNISNSYSKVTIPQGGNCFSVTSSNAIVNSYYDNQTCTKIGGGGVGKNSTQMQTQSTYSGWDFANIWMINPSKNGGYPYLRWQNL